MLLPSWRPSPLTLRLEVLRFGIWLGPRDHRRGQRDAQVREEEEQRGEVPMRELQWQIYPEIEGRAHRRGDDDREDDHENLVRVVVGEVPERYLALVEVPVLLDNLGHYGPKEPEKDDHVQQLQAKAQAHNRPRIGSRER